MPSRIARVAGLFLLLLLFGATTASAATIDPELQAVLDANKHQPVIIPVLMIFPENLVIDDLVEPVDGETPGKRRDRVIAALKKQARKSQANVWGILGDENAPGTLAYADLLYLANSIAFGGDRDLVVAVADIPGTEGAILFHDRDYDFTEISHAASAEPSGTKSAEADTSWNVLYIHADRVWRELGFTGEGILVGHVDSGVWLTHPDLVNQIWSNPGEVPGNEIDDDGNGYIDDVQGWDFGDGDNDPTDDALAFAHGTHTAGTVVGDGASGNVTGVAPGATLIPAKVVSSSGGAPLSNLWAGQQYCLENGARIITMSWGIVGEIPGVYLRNDRYNAAAIRAAGVVFFNSAGNYHNDFAPPLELGMTARVPAPWSGTPVPYSSTGGVITIGGSGYKSDEPLNISSQGPADWGDIDPWFDWPYDPGSGLIKPDLTAPGANIKSTLPPPFYYSPETWTGTSMACPHAAGTAALMLEKNPTLSPAGVDSIMEQTARDAGLPGKDNVMGAGVIDAFAAVSEVGLDLLPNLELTAYHPDPNGNATLDAGELAEVTFELGNVGFVDATGVYGYLDIIGNPHVAVLADTIPADFPDILVGLRGENSAMPFELAVSPVAPQGFPFTLVLTIGTGEGFERIFDIPGYVGLPDYRTHDVGSVYLTVTDNGGVGYLNDGRAQGVGMGVTGQPSSLFISSLWAGTDLSHVCNNDLQADGLDPVEWRTRMAPTGRVQDLMGAIGDQTFTSAFQDSGLAEPLGIEVEQTTWAYSGTGADEFVILEYRFANTSQQDIEGYYSGLFMDWDVMDTMDNGGGTDLQHRAVWICHPTGTCFGATVLGGQIISNLSLIENPEYLYPQSHIPDPVKMQFLTGNLSQAQSEQNTDLSCIASVGPVDIPAGTSVRVAFAMVHGANEAEFLAHCAEAAVLYSPASGLDDGSLVPAPFRLAQNSPNPFNPTTSIQFAVPRDGHVRLSIFDLSGRAIRTLIDRPLAAGEHAAAWDGRDQSGLQAASGVYIYRVQTAAGTLSRKMMLVK